MHPLSRILFAALLCGALAGAARADVVVVHPKSAITSLSREQVAQIYLGRADTLQPIDRMDDPSLRGEFYTRVAGKSLAQVKGTWSKLIFTGRATPPVEVTSAAALKKAVAANVNAIGYLDAAEVDASVRPVVVQ
jgi:ABC-type phosphate transport system substrate-binding protein